MIIFKFHSAFYYPTCAMVQKGKLNLKEKLSKMSTAQS